MGASACQILCILAFSVYTVIEGMEDPWSVESITNTSFYDVYTLDKELERGAESVVYRCVHKETQVSWTAKIINKKVDREMISTEIEVLQRLKHPNMIQLKELYETPEELILVLELVSGEAMIDRIATRSYYSERDATKFVKEILEAVKFLHDNDIVHSDLQPENFLYEDSSENAKLKLADFSSAKIVSEDSNQMSTECGTPEYCAPELLRGHSYTSSVDMWSIGVITYTLLCGYEPFYGEDKKELFSKILIVDYDFNEEWWDDVGENGKDIIRKLLVEDPKNRLTAAQALAHPWLTAAGRNDHLESALDKLKAFVSRKKLPVTNSGD